MTFDKAPINMDNYPIVPGRGLVTHQSTEMRIEYLETLGLSVQEIKKHNLHYTDIRNKIESFVGSVEIPLGLVGPLLFKNNGSSELVYSVVGTLEGTLVASMNRGAKAISLSGGFNAEIIHQKMIRAPLFQFSNRTNALIFSEWIFDNFKHIKKIAENYSLHAKLIEITPLLVDKSLHAKFIYTTSDASGQNMTTTCTWHAMLWIIKQFQKDTGIEIKDYIIEGNSSSDKKVSIYSMQQGRGIHVVAECFLEEGVINRVLRTTSDNILKYFLPSVEAAKQDGMMGYNFNVANTIAAIFAATGQDLASIHESSLALLDIKKASGGLHLFLKLPTLVIGTVGGGTSLPKQKKALELMDCFGNGKVQRFAKLIAGFALSLELSTCAAIVSGEFAKAHEKLGRNKPINWLLMSDINIQLVRSCLKENNGKDQLTSISIEDENLVENGIIINLSGRVNKKLIGFIPITLNFVLKNGKPVTKKILIKSKALDIDVINGLHLMAASIDPALADLIFKYRDFLEYKNSHTKELFIYELLDANGFDSTPRYYGKYLYHKREAYLLFMELMNKNELKLFNSENSPHLWDETTVKNTISEINKLHQFFAKPEIQSQLKDIHIFDANHARPLYEKLIDIIALDEEYSSIDEFYQMKLFLDEFQNSIFDLGLPLTIIHNDFNPRNIAIRKNGNPAIYDWELAVINLPHRDIVEFLSFVLTDGFTQEQFLDYLHYHHSIAASNISWSKWKEGYIRSLKEYLVARVSFYKAAGFLMKLKFSDRIMRNAFRMIQILKSKSSNPKIKGRMQKELP